MVSYDDANSFGTLRTQLLVGYPLICNHKTAEKGKFIHDLKLGGFAIYETGGDYNNLLVDAILSGLEKSS
jgi:hypothetical protein